VKPSLVAAHFHPTPFVYSRPLRGWLKPAVAAQNAERARRPRQQLPSSFHLGAAETGQAIGAPIKSIGLRRIIVSIWSSPIPSSKRLWAKMRKDSGGIGL